MKPKILLSLALVLSGGLGAFCRKRRLMSMKSKIILALTLLLSGCPPGEFQTKADIGIPVVAAPEMRECPEPTIKDLGLWDDALRFENLDIVLLRRQDSLFSYSPATGDLRRIHTAPNMIDSHLVEGMTWKEHQWLFCQSGTVTPFAVDLSNAKTASFEIPGVKMPGKYGPAIHAIINAGSGPGTIIAINGDNASGWPRDGNRPLYFWMSLESGKVVKFPTGWDKGYFSADQKRAVFQGISTNAMMYSPWITVDMATGNTIDDLPDRTKGLWSEPTFGYVPSISPWDPHDYRRHIWELRSPQTPMTLLNPQPGRGFIDDKFAGLSFDGVAYPLTIPGIDHGLCLDARAEGNLAVFQIELEGFVGNSIWATRLNRQEPPWLLGRNCSFEMLGGQHCALLGNNRFPESAPEALVCDIESNTAWNILDGVPLWSAIMARADSGSRHGTDDGPYASGVGRRVTLSLIPGFGSTAYGEKVLCLCSTINVVPANASPPPAQRISVLLTAQGRRYQINFPPSSREWLLTHSWLHNSGKVIVCQQEYTAGQPGQLHLYVADLHLAEQ